MSNNSWIFNFVLNMSLCFKKCNKSKLLIPCRLDCWIVSFMSNRSLDLIRHKIQCISKSLLDFLNYKYVNDLLNVKLKIDKCTRHF